MKKKTAIIVNPISGMGRQKKIETLLKDNLNQDLFDYTVRYTERIHHGTDLAREAVDQGYDCVVAVGGDGSVNDVAQGIKEKGHASGMPQQPQRGVKAAKSVRPLTFGGSMPPKAVCKSTSLLHGNFICIEKIPITYYQ